MAVAGASSTFLCPADILYDSCAELFKAPRSEQSAIRKLPRESTSLRRRNANTYTQGRGGTARARGRARAWLDSPRVAFRQRRLGRGDDLCRLQIDPTLVANCRRRAQGGTLSAPGRPRGARALSLGGATAGDAHQGLPVHRDARRRSARRLGRHALRPARPCAAAPIRGNSRARRARTRSPARRRLRRIRSAAARLGLARAGSRRAPARRPPMRGQGPVSGHRGPRARRSPQPRRHSARSGAGSSTTSTSAS